jgi:hypothetical protein
MIFLCLITKESNLRKKNCLNYKTKTKYRCKSKKLAGKSKLIHTTKTIANPKTFSSKKPFKPCINCHVKIRINEIDLDDNIKEKLELLLFKVESSSSNGYVES